MSLFQSRILSRSLHRRQDSTSSSDQTDEWSPAGGTDAPQTGTVTTILPPPKAEVKEVADLGLFGAYSSSSSDESEEEEESEAEIEERKESVVAEDVRCRNPPPMVGQMAKLRYMISELVKPVLEKSEEMDKRERALAAAPWPIREQVPRLRHLIGDDKSTSQWQQFECRLHDCLDVGKLSMTRLGETTVEGIAAYSGLEGDHASSVQEEEAEDEESASRSVVSSVESAVDEEFSRAPESPESSPSPEGSLSQESIPPVVYSCAPQININAVKERAKIEKEEVLVDPDEIERELEALVATHEQETKRKREESFPIDGFKLEKEELPERPSKWACRPHEDSDQEDRRRWIFSRTPRVRLKDPNAAADRSTHGLVGKWTSLQRRRAGGHPDRF